MFKIVSTYFLSFLKNAWACLELIVADEGVAAGCDVTEVVHWRSTTSSPSVTTCRFAPRISRLMYTLVSWKENSLSKGLLHTLRPKQNGRHFADDIGNFFLGCCILIQISPQFVSNVPINNSPALVWILAWGWTGCKPVAEPIWWWWYVWMTHKLVTRPRWISIGSVECILQNMEI